MITHHKMPLIAIIGGDRRQASMIRELSGYGYPLKIWGITNWGSADHASTESCDNWKAAIADASAVILPLPATLDGIRVNASEIAENERPRLDVLFHEMEGMLLLGGRLSEEFQRHAEIHAIECIDYFNDEPLQLKNALATAEGAISIAMKELTTTIDGAAVSVIGYGRIGEILAHKLYGLGADVTVYARRKEVLTRAEMSHLRAIKLEESALIRIKKETQIIFNTVPMPLFTERVIHDLPKECIFIDLASAPGGIDHCAAEKAGLKTIWATALPGKYAPESAGKYIAQTIRSILADREFR